MRNRAAARTASTVVYCVERVFHVTRVVASACCFRTWRSASSWSGPSSLSNCFVGSRWAARRSWLTELGCAVSPAAVCEARGAGIQRAAERQEVVLGLNLRANAEQRARSDVGGHRPHRRPGRLPRSGRLVRSRLGLQHGEHPRDHDDDGERDRDLGLERIGDLLDSIPLPGRGLVGRRWLPLAHAKK